MKSKSAMKRIAFPQKNAKYVSPAIYDDCIVSVFIKLSLF